MEQLNFDQFISYFSQTLGLPCCYTLCVVAEWIMNECHVSAVQCSLFYTKCVFKGDI